MYLFSDCAPREKRNAAAGLRLRLRLQARLETREGT